MCEECIKISLEVTKQTKIRCPLCKAITEENPLHFLPVLDDFLLEQQQRIEEKKVIGSTLTVEEKRKRDRHIFDELYERVVTRRLVAVPSPAPEIIDLTEF